MTETGIKFQVETKRVLEILSKEIYDSPLAMLRENVQNAYDAVLMRAALEDRALADYAISIQLTENHLEITDNGIGMTEEVLRNNFWKAGSSGKHTELARKSGVIGTFGIGAMANFGVCTELKVETRAVGQDDTLISSAARDTLAIAENCITLERQKTDRPPGTTLRVAFDSVFRITEKEVAKYLEPYVRFVPVPIKLNGQVISTQSLHEHYIKQTKDSTSMGEIGVTSGSYECVVDCFVDANAIVSCRIRDLIFAGNKIQGDVVLAQGTGIIMGLRNYFGLAPAPVSGYFQLGGAANLAILHPTAGREALSRESIEHLNRIIVMADYAIAERLGGWAVSDRSNNFMQYILAHNRLEKAAYVTIETEPGPGSVALGYILQYAKGKTSHFYTGRDSQILNTFSSGESVLFCVSQSNPRRNLQLQYLREIAKITEVPDRATILKEYSGTELGLDEAAFLVRVATTLSDDYLLPDADIKFADITHGVAILAEKRGESVVIRIARDGQAVKPVLRCYREAPEVFTGLVKDFVRVHLFKRISDFVPSSTRQGADVLFKMLQRNKELYRYEQSELGELEPLLADYLSGGKSLGEVIRVAQSHSRPQSIRVQSEDVGRLEAAMPDVVSGEATNTAEPMDSGLQAAPAIMRPELQCDSKILLAGGKYPQLNNFELFLGLSDRLFKTQSDFFRFPHTTKVIWAGHRVIYIIGHASGGLTLYYDIELKDPLESVAPGGAIVPTTTLFTKNRIFLPVPEALVPEFKISGGAKEFYVRFDTIFTDQRSHETKKAS